jgi:predicted RNase H-like HicB family nuclease
MKPKKSGKQPLVAYLCHFRPEPEGGFMVTCPKLPPVITYGETLQEAQANAREAIELCLEVLRAANRSQRLTGISPRPSISSCRSPPWAHESATGVARPRGRRSAGAGRLRGGHIISCGTAMIPAVPVHRNDLPPGTLRAILQQARLSRAQFLDLL